MMYGSTMNRSSASKCAMHGFAAPGPVQRHACVCRPKTSSISRLRSHLPSPLLAGQPKPEQHRCSYLVVRSLSGAVHDGARIKVVGVGGGGGNALQRMIQNGLQGIEFWAVNTDVQALAHHNCQNRMQIGSEVTRGLGCGGNPELGEAAATESEEALKQMVAGADLVFVTAGMGGGTGSGAAPVVAKISKDAGILTVGVVTYPFSFEGRRRRNQAAQAIRALRESVDSVVIIPNDRLLEVSGEATSLTDAFSLADDVLRQGVQGISDIITVPGMVNVDFADVRSVMSNAGTSMLGIGAASGPDRAEQAAMAAGSTPLIQHSVERATGIIFNITGGPDMTLSEVNRVSNVVTSLADPAANIIFGAVVDPKYEGRLQVTIIATGFSSSYEDTLFSDDSSKKRAHVQQQQAEQQQTAETSTSDFDEPAAPADGQAWNNATKRLFGKPF